MTKTVETILLELNKKGFRYKILQDIFKRNVLSLIEVEVILRNLISLKDKTTPEIIILSQCVMKCNEFIEDPSTLITIFETNKNEGNRSSVGIVLVKINTIDLSVWFKKQLTEPSYAFYKLSLIDAIPKKMGFKTNDQRLDFIKEIFDTYRTAPNLITYFKKYGSREDVSFLNEKLQKYPNDKNILRLLKHFQD